MADQLKHGPRDYLTEWASPAGGKWADHGYSTIEADPYQCVVQLSSACLADHSEPWAHCHVQIDESFIEPPRD